MCGFVVGFSTSGNRVDNTLISRMSDMIQHRGPDAEGFYQTPWCVLAFRRLAIQDLSARASQPMVYRNTSGRDKYVMVFNGEIYNYIELRKELIELGHVFTSTGDSEVVMKSYIEWKEDCFEKFTGMFSIVLIDLESKKATLVRDHLGIKPLYYFEKEGVIYFTSEVKVLYLLSGGLTLNEEKIFEQLAYRYVYGKQTIFKNVNRIRPGTVNIIDCQGRIKQRKFYDVLNQLEMMNNKNTSFEEVEECLAKSVEIHTRSDVGYNLQFSGGVDSSYLLSALSALNSKLRTYSVALENEHSEAVYQNIAQKIFQNKHNSFIFNQDDYVSSIEKATWHMDFPLIHSACPFLMLLSQESAKTSKVVLTGEGADELFVGYSRNILDPKTKLYSFLEIGLGRALTSRLAFFSSLLSTGVGLGAQNGPSMDQVRSVLLNVPNDISSRKEVVDRFRSADQKILASDQTSYLEGLLERQDKMSMASSVEARVPFVTAELFDMLNGLSYGFKTNGGKRSKHILKTFLKNKFDGSYLNRRKSGFRLPIASWLRDESKLGKHLILLQDTKFRHRGFYNTSKVSKYIKEHRDGKADHYKILLTLINFEIWHRLFIDRSIWL